MLEPSRCPDCGAQLSPGVSPEMCPKCLMQAALEDPSSSAQQDVSSEDQFDATIDSEADLGEAWIGKSSDRPVDQETLDSDAFAADVLSDAEQGTRRLGPGARIKYFGDYEIVDEIARGGMGVVYKARQVKLDRIVAVKMILGGQLADETAVQRFYTEAQAAANLDHVGIVPIFEVGEHEGHHFFSMGLIEGQSLADRLRDGPLPPKEAARLIQQAAEAVAYAHEHAVIHRDIKPANILLERRKRQDEPDSSTCDFRPSDLRPKLTDFGLAKRTSDDSGMTATGQILGTPSFMPPEQAAGKMDEIGPLADVYSLGATLYATLAGRPPFQGASILDTIQQLKEQEPVSPRQLNPKIPPDLETICLKCLEKEPRQRYGTAGELADELQRFLNGEPIRARPISTPTRVWRWCKRKPAMAGLWAAIALLLLTFSIGGPIVAYRQADLRGQAEDARAKAEERRQEAEDARAETERKRQEAEESRQKAEQESRRAYRSCYAAQLNSAQRDWESTEIKLLLGRLRTTRPEVTGGNDVRGFEWHYWNRLCHSELMILIGHSGPVTSVSFSPDGSRIASGGYDSNVKVWDAATGQETLTLKGHGDPVFSLSFNPDGSRIATGRQDGTVNIWDAATVQEMRTLKGHTSMVTSVSFSPDGLRIASGGLDRTVKVWGAFAGAEELRGQ